jgi:RNA-directed DNA polymerase
MFYSFLPQFTNIDELSSLINLSKETLYIISNNVERYYKRVEVPKPSGGIRILACPSPKLKAIQAWILRNILDKLDHLIIYNSTAFRRGLGIYHNVNRHKGNDYFLCLDICDFFPSTNKRRVYKLFEDFGYNKQASFYLTNFCTYQNGLPQGGVTSPALSNLLNIDLDREIYDFCKQRNIVYTRYADDITLSSNNPDILKDNQKNIENIISRYGYTINNKKTRYLFPGMSRKITGLIYSDDEEIRIGKKQKKLLRAKIYSLETKTLDEDEYLKLFNHIRGWLSFLKGVDIKTYDQLRSYWDALKTKKNKATELSRQQIAVTRFITEDH